MPISEPLNLTESVVIYWVEVNHYSDFIRFECNFSGKICIRTGNVQEEEYRKAISELLILVANDKAVEEIEIRYGRRRFYEVDFNLTYKGSLEDLCKKWELLLSEKKN